MDATRQPGGPSTGLALRDPVPWHDLLELVESAEETGYEALFLPEIRGREPFATLAALAGVTSRLRLATGVVPMAAREPVVTAMAAATIQELSGGRMILGIGPGDVGRGALEGLRAHVLAVRGLLAGETVDVGERERLSLVPRPAPPVWISALGPKAMRLAGEIADGALLNWCPPERVAFARERVREGAEATGRDPASVTMAVYVRACVGQDEDMALGALREAAGQYASYGAYRRQLEAVGLGEEAASAAAAHRDRRPEAVPESLVRAVCLLGDASEARMRLREFREAGADLPVVYPVPCREVPSSILGTLFALAPSPVVA